MNLVNEMFKKLFRYELVNLRRSSSRLDHHLRLLLQAINPDCVIDVGANEGQYGALLREIGFRGRIVSFEPVPSSYRVLEQRALADGRWHAFPLALGAAREKKKLHQYDMSLLSSFLEPTAHAHNQFADRMSLTDSHEVDVCLLDDVMLEIARSGPAGRIFLKVDTQGYDLEVFRGSTATLPNVLGIQSELSVVPFYVGMPSYLEVLAAYRSAGFEVTGFYPVCRAKDRWTIGEFDCVMVREDAEIVRPSFIR